MSVRPQHPDRKKLAAWLQEREIDRAMDVARAAPAYGPNLYTLTKKTAFAFKPGHIVILKPSAHALDYGPVYVLLLEKSHDRFWVAVPFSRYQTAAVPGEWNTGLPTVFLKVLCLWNARLVDETSFIAGAVKKWTAAKLRQAREAYACVHAKQHADLENNPWFGPALVHPADPRYEYLDEERERLDLHVRNVSAMREDGVAKTAWLLAAEGRPRYGNK